MKSMGLFDFLNDIPDDYEPKQRMSAEETEQTFKYLQNHPLFMNEIPENFENNPEMLALQNLAYDDTPFNIAKSLNVQKLIQIYENNNLTKNQANHILKEHPYQKYFLKKAIDLQTDALQQECGDPDLISKIFSNRALAHQRLKNFKASIQDCKSSLELNPQFVKPYFRAAQCLISIMHYSDALKMCDAALLLLPKEPEIEKLRDECIIELKNLEKQKQREKDLQELRNLCASKGIQLKQAKISLPQEYQPKQLGFEDENRKSITTPIIISYPEFSQRDFIQYASESSTLQECLFQLFQEPLPWDYKNQYDWKYVSFFIQLEDGNYAEVNKKATIIQIMRGYKVIIPMLIELICVCGNKDNQYYAKEFRHQFKVIE